MVLKLSLPRVTVLDICVGDHVARILSLTTPYKAGEHETIKALLKQRVVPAT